jgi:hypothetical protein
MMAGLSMKPLPRRRIPIEIQQRVKANTVHASFKMKMSAGSDASISNQPNRLTLRDRITHADIHRALMEV